jgi:hypothetical protein
LYLAKKVRNDEKAMPQLAASTGVWRDRGLSLGPAIAALDRGGFAGPNIVGKR